MRSTRSITRSLSSTAATSLSAARSAKRKSPVSSDDEDGLNVVKTTKNAKKTRHHEQDIEEDTPSPTPVPKSEPGTLSISPAAEVIPAVLTFDLPAAKEHLISADSRFKRLFDKIPCRPFEELDAVEPFRTLTSSILGQQISWKAARSIKHKFIRLYNPALPEQPPAPNEKGIEFFPTAEAVTKTNVATLRTAGLSARKAEYVLDLAGRFADGRLSAHKLASAPAQEVYDMLIQVKGIGPWTIEMFSIFSLRRPDILPTGDLGIQKGLLRWMIAGHSPEDARNIKIAAARLPGNEHNEDSADAPSTPAPRLTLGVESPEATLASPSKDVGSTSSILPAPKEQLQPPQTPVKKGRKNPAIPPPTPLVAPSTSSTPLLPPKVTPLADGLTLGTLKSRLAGKKIKKGLYLTPAEMEALTITWAPYRSIAIWYLWSIVDGETE